MIYVAVNYLAINTECLFKITKAKERKGYVLEVVTPTSHVCEKNHRSVPELGKHLHLNNTAIQVLCMAVAHTERNSKEPVTQVSFIVAKQDVQCNH